MANRIDNCLDSIEAKLKADLVKADGTGVLKVVERRIINPLIEVNVPVFSFVPSRGERKGEQGSYQDWDIALLGQLCTRGKNTKCDEAVTELAGEIMASLKAWNDGNAPGGVIDVPVWDFWYQPHQQALVPVGALFAMRLQLDGQLKITA